MTRRQQLILFVLALATLSTCTVGFALTMNLVRDRSRQPEFVDLPPATRQAQAASTAEGSGWSLPATPTPPPTETRQPTPTNTHVPTWTPAPTYTPTETRVPTETPTPTPIPTNTRVPAASVAAAPKANPSPTPTPEFPFIPRVSTAGTGSPQTTRITGLVWQWPTVPNGIAGYQMRLVDPSGAVHLGEMSGPGGADSTCKTCGDNHWMNMKVELPGYQPGTYSVTLVQGEKQVSAKVTFTMITKPLQYVHIDFVPWE